MKRFASTIVTLIVIANVLPMNALAGCGGGGGGYRPSIRPYHGSAPAYQPAPVYHRQPQTIYQQPVQQQYIPQPVRTISTRQQIASPQIRIAPSQRRLATNQQPQIRTSQPAPAQPTQQAQVQPTTPQTQQPTAPQPQQSNNNNVNSALALLAGQPATQPETTPAPQASTASTAQYVGNWTASVGNNATVQLTLQADGSFNWVANKGGKQSRFDGRFTIADGKLTLARSSDNQKLSGAMTFSGNGFNFKLNGAKDSGLNFTQQS